MGLNPSFPDSLCVMGVSRHAEANAVLQSHIAAERSALQGERVTTDDLRKQLASAREQISVLERKLTATHSEMLRALEANKL